jgi:hypothetical protein
MQRTRFFSPLAALFFLGACATAPDASSDSRTWITASDGDEAQLIYGTPDSDDAPFSLRCRPGTGKVSLTVNGDEPGSALVLISGARKATFRTTEQPDLLNGGVIRTAETTTGSPVVRSFRDSGRLAFLNRQGRAELPATAEERARIKQFLDRCGAA